jgi:hypothetical protein
MTYLDVVYRYGGTPGESELRAIDGMREVYGIRGVQFNETERTLKVGFDASRMNKKRTGGGSFWGSYARGAQENLWPKYLWSAPLRATSSVLDISTWRATL